MEHNFAMYFLWKDKSQLLVRSFTISWEILMGKLDAGDQANYEVEQIILLFSIRKCNV